MNQSDCIGFKGLSKYFTLFFPLKVNDKLQGFTRKIFNVVDHL